MLRDLANGRIDLPAHNVFEHVNAYNYDMQSVRLTISEDPAMDRRSSHIHLWRGQELHWPAGINHIHFYASI